MYFIIVKRKKVITFENNKKYIMKLSKIILSALLMVVTATPTMAEYTLNYNAEIIGNAGSGDFAPYFMSSNVHGVITQPYSTLIKLDASNKYKLTERLSIYYGATVIGGYTSKTDYELYNPENKNFGTHKESPSAAWIQQLYLDVNYRSLFLTLGAKESGSKMLNDRLSSGDMTMSANARPMPGVRAGFIKPQNIPFTNGWVQISGELGYYKQIDSDWLENHYNYYNNFITTDLWYNYKYCYFHTKPSQPFSVTVGMQAACQFGGIMNTYANGEWLSTVDMSPSFKSFYKAFIPGSGGTNLGDQVYYEGNHVGSWDIMGRYRLKNNSEIKIYYQSPWEDGSGIGMMNGFDGLYGIEYKSSNDKSIINGVVIEYINLKNQGGPIHWAPNDKPGTTIAEEATGADNYYNNYAYNGYQYYGMSLGSPVLKSPIYNTDGYMAFTDTRLWSLHLAIEGTPLKNWTYRAKFFYTDSWGTVFRPYSKIRNNTSAMLECVYSWHNLPGLNLKGQLAIDRGDLFGDNFGVLLSVSYRGLLKF